MQRYQGRIQGLTSHPSLRQKKTYYKKYYISGYTASQWEGLTMTQQLTIIVNRLKEPFIYWVSVTVKASQPVC